MKSTLTDWIDRSLRAIAFHKWEIIAFVLILGIKTANFFYLSSHTHLLDFNLFRDCDMITFHNLARSILEKGWLSSESVGLYAPLYSMIIATLYQLFGLNCSAVILFQIVIGTLNAFLFSHIVKRLISKRAGNWALALFFLFTDFWIFELFMLREILVVFFILLSILSVIHFQYSSKSYPQIFIMGLIMGLSIALRENFIILLPFFTALFLVSLPGKQWLKTALVYSAGIMLILLPLLIRYYLISGQIGMSPQNGQLAWKVSNSYDSNGSTCTPVKPLIPITSPDFYHWQLTKAKVFFSGYHLPDNIDIYQIQRQSPFLKFTFSNFGFLFAFGLIGMIWSLKEWRKFLFLYYIAVFFSVSFILFLVISRYRFGIIPIFMFFTVYLLFMIYRSVNERKIWISMAGVFLSIPLIYYFGDFRTIDYFKNNSWFDYRYGMLLLEKGDTIAAKAELLNAVENPYQPTAPAFVELARIYLKEGAIDQAESVTQRLTRLNPDYPDANYLMAVIFFHRRDFNQSLRFYRLYAKQITGEKQIQIQQIIRMIETQLQLKPK